MTTEDGRTTLTRQHLDEDGKVIDGETKYFDNQIEAEAYMAAHDQDDKNSLSEPVHEKPASQMSEADAVALNADVHETVPQQSERVVTDGEKEQVEAGLHPDPSEGNPAQD